MGSQAVSLFGQPGFVPASGFWQPGRGGRPMQYSHGSQGLLHVVVLVQGGQTFGSVRCAASQPGTRRTSWPTPLESKMVQQPKQSQPLGVMVPQTLMQVCVCCIEHCAPFGSSMWQPLRS